MSNLLLFLDFALALQGRTLTGQSGRWLGRLHNIQLIADYVTRLSSKPTVGGFERDFTPLRQGVSAAA